MPTLSKPPNVIPSKDGQKLLETSWPVQPEALMALGLPLNATQEQHRLYILAKQTPVSAETAAVVVVEIIRAMQITRAISFDEAINYLKEKRPVLWEAAQKAMTLGASAANEHRSQPFRSREQAGAIFIAKVHHHMRQSGLGYQEAYAECRNLYPEEYAQTLSNPSTP